MPAAISARGCKKYNALVDRLVLDFESVGNHEDEALSPWALDHEAALVKATALYRVRSGSSVERVGFVVHDEISWLGAAPHALVGDAGLLYVRERKTLKSWSAHRREPSTKAELARIHCLAFVCGRAWIDRVDYLDQIGLAPDKLARTRIDFDLRWFSDQILTSVTMVWRDVAQRLRDRRA